MKTSTYSASHFNSHRFNAGRERRYPVLTALDLLLHFALSLTAIALTVIALGMLMLAVLPAGTVRLPGL